MTSLFKTLFLLVILLGCFSLKAQNHITLTKYRNSKTIKIHVGQIIKVKQNSDIPAFKGEVLTITDSTVTLKKDSTSQVISYNNIAWIKHKHMPFIGQFAQGSAQSIALAGPVYIVIGIVNNAIVDIEPVFQERNAKVGGILVLTGIAIYGVVELFSNKRRTTKKWKIIVTDFSSLI